MKVALGVALTRLLTSHGLRNARRFIAGLPRRWGRTPAQLHYFHQLDDPYSHLLVQVLPGLLSNYRIALQVHLVPAPDASAAPDRERLQAWSRRDAAQLAGHLGLQFVDRGEQPAAHLLALAEQAMAAVLGETEVLSRAAAIGNAFWQRDEAALQALLVGASGQSRDAALARGQALRARQGHYLGGMLCFDREWFWGVDRLAQLQQRLLELDLGLLPNAPPLCPQREVQCRVKPHNGVRPQLHFYCSLRSPYTYLAIGRVRQLAAHYGAELCLRPVLPMAMRGLPVPLAKRLYIVRDCKREADRLGLPFGRIADPLGTPTERGLAVLFKALEQGLDAPAFLESFMRGVFAEGIDAGSRSGLLHLIDRAGLPATLLDQALADQRWRGQAESNRSDLLTRGLWGVPAFRVDQQPLQWGQDRLWLIERELIAATCAAV